MPAQTLNEGSNATIPPHPDRCCDIVMKGGVTSGIVYPLAVCELAKDYRFVSVGGTSAGAIAAALTAAAEYRRRHGDVRGFTDHLAKLPEQLGSARSGGKSLLLSLFQPNASTSSVYESILGMTGKRGPIGKILSVLLAMLRIAPAVTICGAGIWLFGLYAIWSICNGPGFWVVVLPLLLTSFLWCAVPAGLLAYSVRKLSAAIAENGYGLCSGFIQRRRSNSPPPLTEWLADMLDEVAGKSDPNTPLTFGDLWNAPSPAPSEPNSRTINLQMITTSLTHGRPYQLPFTQSEFSFSPREFRDLFPARIVEWMVAHSKPARNTEYRTFPEARDLPVVVATRMSLSFPLLISAVPLYAVDWSREANKHVKSSLRLERCWFSDGGICSNFPVHFFDSPLPRWPTFAINLRPFHPDHPRSGVECDNIWMPTTNGDGLREQWMRYGAGPGPAAILEFLGSIFETMQNWTDNTQLRVPGYRDRVAHVHLAPDEGGLNLSMDRAFIDRLSERGRCAGEKLRLRFTGNDPNSDLTWDNHRWVRYRSTMALLEKHLSAIAQRYQSPLPSGGATYRDLVKRRPGDPPTSYPWRDKAQQSLAEDMSEEVVNLSQNWQARHISLETGAPVPMPELRIRPRT